MLNDDIRSLFLRVEPVGSRVTCNPPPMDTDADFLCLAPTNTTVVSGFERGGSNIADADNRLPPEARFTSLKCGDTNLIITTSPEFFRRFMAASAVAKRLNLLNKADRVALFQAVLYGNGGE